MKDYYTLDKTGILPWRWQLTRHCTAEYDSPSLFQKLVGLFRVKKDAEAALERIQAHKDRDFAEWFYVKEQFYAHEYLDIKIMERHFYKLWQALETHYEISRKREILDDFLLVVGYTSMMYEDVIDDMQNGW